MVELPKEILAEKENIEVTLSHLKNVLLKTPKTVIELSAMGAFIHNIYNGIENIIKQIYKINKLKFPKSENWHKELLQSTCSNHILSKNIIDKLFDYLGFRHFFIHGYGFMIEEKQIENLANYLPQIWDEFIVEIKNYYTTLGTKI